VIDDSGNEFQDIPADGSGSRPGAAGRPSRVGDLCGVFDREYPTEVCEFVTGCGSVGLGDPLAWQQPRQYAVGVRLEF
jgi:hypothetical protein